MISDLPLEVLSIFITEHTVQGCSVYFLHVFQQQTDTKKFLVTWTKSVRVSNIQDLTKMLSKK